MPHGPEGKLRRKQERAAQRAGVPSSSAPDGSLSSSDEASDFGSLGAAATTTASVVDDPLDKMGAPQYESWDPAAAARAMPKMGCCADDSCGGGGGGGGGGSGGARKAATERRDKNVEGEGFWNWVRSIKPMPLFFLLLMFGTFLITGSFYVMDNFGSKIAPSLKPFANKVSYKLGLGSTPRSRVVSFYEKHSPEKLDEVDGILEKYYGDYPTLTKRLEKKYQDYGYFLNWDKDEQPFRLANARIEEAKSWAAKKWTKHAPPALQRGLSNMKLNFQNGKKAATKFWKKKVWPKLEPIFGAPGTAEDKAKKKREDAKASEKGRKKKKNDFRDDEDLYEM